MTRISIQPKKKMTAQHQPQFIVHAKKIMNSLQDRFDRKTYVVMKVLIVLLLFYVAMKSKYVLGVGVAILVVCAVLHLLNKHRQTWSSWKEIPHPPTEDERFTLKRLSFDGRFCFVLANGKSVTVVQGTRNDSVLCGRRKRVPLWHGNHAQCTTTFHVHQKSTKLMNPFEEKAVRNISNVKEHVPCFLKVDTLQPGSWVGQSKPLVITATPGGIIETRTLGDSPEAWQKFLLVGGGNAPSILTCHGYFLSTASLRSLSTASLRSCPSTLPGSKTARGGIRRSLKIMFGIVLVLGLLNVLLLGYNTCKHVLYVL